jgi:hypothetical protein
MTRTQLEQLIRAQETTAAALAKLAVPLLHRWSTA